MEDNWLEFPFHKNPVKFEPPPASLREALRPWCDFLPVKQALLPPN
jgi:hypothetical protein